MKIKIEVTEEEAVLTVQTGKEVFIERHIPIDFSQTNLDSKAIIDQMQEKGLSEDFINDFEEAVDDFLLHNLLCLAYEWTD